MRAIAKLFVLVLAFSITPSANAQDTAPREMIEAIYDDILAGGEPPLPGERPDWLSPRLYELFMADVETGIEFSTPGRLSFDVFVAGQDWRLSDVQITQRTPKIGEGDQARLDHTRAVVTARFKNFGEPTVVRYYFEQNSEGRWQIDEITFDEGWVLSIILKYGDY